MHLIIHKCISSVIPGVNVNSAAPSSINVRLFLPSRVIFSISGQFAGRLCEIGHNSTSTVVSDVISEVSYLDFLNGELNSNTLYNRHLFQPILTIWGHSNSHNCLATSIFWRMFGGHILAIENVIT